MSDLPLSTAERAGQKIKKFVELSDDDLEHLHERSLREAYQLLRQHHVDETTILYSRLQQVQLRLEEVAKMAHRRVFNGHEINFLMEMEDRIVYRERLGTQSDGYDHTRTVIRHPDGKLYEFVYRDNAEYGIVATKENPNDTVEAWEVEARETVTTTYVRKQ